jgi:hypothetical protein
VNEFADSNPSAWLDETQVLVVRARARATAKVRGLTTEARGMLSSALFGLAVAGLTALSVSSSDHIVRAYEVTNSTSANGLSRRHWEGLAHALARAPDVAEHEEPDEVAPLL